MSDTLLCDTNEAAADELRRAAREYAASVLTDDLDEAREAWIALKDSALAYAHGRRLAKAKRKREAREVAAAVLQVEVPE